MGKTKNRVYLRSRSRSKVLSSELDLDLSLKKIEIMMLSYVCGIGKNMISRLILMISRLNIRV